MVKHFICDITPHNFPLIPKTLLWDMGKVTTYTFTSRHEVSKLLERISLLSYSEDARWLFAEFLGGTRLCCWKA